ncbi:MAG: AAA family ATPase [Clostridiales bacterium]|jgi:predicted kinase|nr:AAA family ATPase [Clostridiales bacterium]
MLIWINGAFGAGKTSAAFELARRLPGSHVFDPENAGYFLRKNASWKYTQEDFQDIELWREINFKILKSLLEDGEVVISPMTLVDPLYFDEIIGRLRREGIELRHFILEAGKEVLIRRLAARVFKTSLGGKENWAVKQADRCIRAFSLMPEEDKIWTNEMSVRDVAEEIASRCGLKLLPDNRPGVVQSLGRLLVLLRHIRL